ncbi:MAG: TIGR00180 family glycosyltransferase [Pseudomonas sp.]
MQVQDMTQEVLPLSERFTLVVMTHNRNAFLRRTLQYYSGFAAKLLVLDSSTQIDETIRQDFPAVEYRHLPQFTYMGLQDKLAYGVEQVTTPFMAFAADDDFLLQGALTESVEFLETNPDYGLCHGYGMMYLARATEVIYYRRDRKGCEDYSSALAENRLMDFMGHFLPPFYAVTRTELLRQWYHLMPKGTRFEWQEIGHTFYLLACAKARILPIPYVVREVNYGGSDHNTNVLTVLTFKDPASVADRERFADFLASIPTELSRQNPERAKQIAIDSFAAMADCLLKKRSLKATRIFRSAWSEIAAEPVRYFDEQQFVEMPFYNKPMFDLLTEIEFLLHAQPAGRLQLKELEGVLLKQQELMRVHANDTDRTIKSRLWTAIGCNAFDHAAVMQLAQLLNAYEEQEEARKLLAWAEQLTSVRAQDRRGLFETMPSGRLLNWLEARKPDEYQVKSIAEHLAKHNGGPKIGIVLLDLEADMFKLQSTFDSLVNGYYKAFKLVVLTTGDLPAVTRPQDTVHFLKVTANNYVGPLNQAAAELNSDWLLLVQAGDQFTPSGLLRASLELLDATGCRAVAMDEIQRQADGSLVDVFRPGVNLDLLQSTPNVMAGHWLIRRDIWVDAGGYSAECDQALEFDLLLRLIEQGGLAGLAHLAEPLLICEAAAQKEGNQQGQILTRHLQSRGYKAEVASTEPGILQIDYRHAERPLVSIILHSQDNHEQLQHCLASILQRTRYQRYEVVIADNCSQSEALANWLSSLEQQGGRIRVLRSEHRLSVSALHNAACQEAKGEYLLLLDAQGGVLNVNWIESLLNQAQRPEVGVVGARLIDAKGTTTQAGLILGLNGSVGSAFVGEPKNAKGYMNRLQVEQSCSAVSGACLMIRKTLYEALGGMDTEHFADVFGDVDLCLKVADSGHLTVWTPQVQIQHPGTLPESAAVADALRDKWRTRFEHDEAYNQNLALTGKGFTLGDASSVNWAQLLA